jgi:hypothetical protein
MKIIDRLPFADRPHFVTVRGETVDVYRNQIIVWISIDDVLRQLPAVLEGLYDMHGNAMEWCLDAWYDYPKGKKEVTVDPFQIGRPDKDTRFVVRGGAWWMGADGCSSHWRSLNHNNANGFRGFRIVLGPEIPNPFPS